MGKNFQLEPLIVVFAFGTPDDGKANNKLREVMFFRQDMDGGEVFTQGEIARGVQRKCNITMKVIEGEEVPTLRIARGAVAYAKENDLRYGVVVVAAKPHMWRCLRDMKMALKEGELDIPIFVEDIPEISWWKWFDKASTQPRTASPWIWLCRDIILWVLPWAIYKRIKRIAG